MGRGHTCHNWVSYEGFTYYLKVVRGHDFWPHLEMSHEQSDLLTPILENGTVSGEMGSQVALMPMVIKFGPCDKGTLCEQFCCVSVDR